MTFSVLTGSNAVFADDKSGIEKTKTLSMKPPLRAKTWKAPSWPDHLSDTVNIVYPEGEYIVRIHFVSREDQSQIIAYRKEDGWAFSDDLKENIKKSKYLTLKEGKTLTIETDSLKEIAY